MVAFNAVLIVTAFGLYYLGSETVRPWMSWIHIAAGISVAAVISRPYLFGQTEVALSKPSVFDYCSGGSPLVRFLARSISVTAIRISARVLRSGASSIACFSAGP